MINIQPQSNFTIIWENNDPSDTTEYYPQVTIRDAISAETIDTVNLALVAGSQSLYMSLWQAPADVSGAGFQINMTVKVYTDSGHTSISDTKAIENRDYLVFDRLRHLGGGGGVDIDYKRVARMLSEELDKRPYPTPDIPKYDQKPVLDALERISEEVRGIVIPLPKETDLTPVLTSLANHVDRLVAEIRELPKPESLNELKKKLDNMSSETQTKPIRDAIAKIQEVFAEDLLDIQRKFEELSAAVKAIPMAVVGGSAPVNINTEQKQPKQRNAADFIV